MPPNVKKLLMIVEASDYSMTPKTNNYLA